MLKIISAGLLLCLTFLALGACGSSPNSGASPSEAQASAQEALGRLDDQVGTGRDAKRTAPDDEIISMATNVPPSAAIGSSSVNNSKIRPKWVDSVESVYSKSQYVAAVGYAGNRGMAEKNGLANLAGFFGQSIFADQTIINTYSEAVKNGVTSYWTDNINMENTVRITASMGTLAAAEIKEVWYDTKNNIYYAAAVMEKSKAAAVYTDMVNANQNMIRNLITMTPAEKNSMEGFSRYQFAAAAADINITYGNILKLIDAPVPPDIVKGDEYRLAAQNIVKTIPVGINVKNDKAGRIQGAFAKALSDVGFRSGGVNSRYILDVNITVSPVNLPSNTNKFARIELGANLTDTSTKSVLLPYNFNGREGHATDAEAENRAYTAAERKIGEEYKDLLLTFLYQLLPKK